MRFTQLIVGQSVGTPSLYDRYYYTDIDNRYILMQSGVSHLESTPQTPPPPDRVRVLPLMKQPPYISIHNL